MLPGGLSPRARSTAAERLARIRLRALVASREPGLPALTRRAPPGRRGRSARPTRRSVARRSSTSSTPTGTVPSPRRFEPPRNIAGREASAGHRHHRSGRTPHVRVPDHQGLPGVRARPRAEQPEGEAGHRREPVHRAGGRRPARPLVVDRRGRAGAARRGLQPRRDELRGAVVPPAGAHRRHHGCRRAADARGDPDRRRRRSQPDPLLPGLVVGDVRQGARDATERGHGASIRGRPTASRRSSAIT